jgi:hypothetical protein
VCELIQRKRANSQPGYNMFNGARMFNTAVMDPATPMRIGGFGNAEASRELVKTKGLCNGEGLQN